MVFYASDTLLCTMFSGCRRGRDMKLSMLMLAAVLVLVPQWAFCADYTFVDRDEIKIIVADFAGPDDGGSNPGDWILINLNDLIDDYDDVSVTRLPRRLSATDPEGDAAELLSSENATMVVWGNYSRTAEGYSVSPAYSTPLQFIETGISTVMTGSGNIRPSMGVSRYEGILELESYLSEEDVMPGGVWKAMAQTYLGVSMNTVGEFRAGSVLLDQALEATYEGWEGSNGYSMALFNAGVSHMALDNNSRGVEIYSELIDLNPELSVAFQNRACGNYYMRNYPQSIDDFTRSLELAPENTDVIFMRGLAYCRNGMQSQGITDFTSFLEIIPHDALTLGNRGYAYYELNMFNEAIQDLQQAVELEDDSASSHNIANLGLSYMGIGEYANAIPCFNTALEKDLNDATAAIILHNRGDCYCWLNYMELGIEDFNAVLQLMPDRIPTLVIRGRAYLFANQIASAMADLNRAIELDQNLYQGYYWRGKAFEKSGNIQAAEQDYNFVLEHADYDEIRLAAQESLEAIR